MKTHIPVKVVRLSALCILRLSAPESGPVNDRDAELPPPLINLAADFLVATITGEDQLSHLGPEFFLMQPDEVSDSRVIGATIAPCPVGVRSTPVSSFAPAVIADENDHSAFPFSLTT